MGLPKIRSLSKLVKTLGLLDNIHSNTSSRLRKFHLLLASQSESLGFI